MKRVMKESDALEEMPGTMCLDANHQAPALVETSGQSDELAADGWRFVAEAQEGLW